MEVVDIRNQLLVGSFVAAARSRYEMIRSDHLHQQSLSVIRVVQWAFRS